MGLKGGPPPKGPSLYGLELEEAEAAVRKAGEPPYRARQIVGGLYERHVDTWEKFSNLPRPLLEKLKSEFDLQSLSLCEDRPSPHGQSAKFLFETREGHLLESVLITQQDRLTVCVSTQLGCKMKCAFCASGTSFARSLTAGEIVEQVAWINLSLRGPKGRSNPEPRLFRPAAPGGRPRNDVSRRVTNVVFMGMGEPLDNLKATLKAIRILQADWGLRLGGRRITVSTVGITPKIEEFVEHTDGRVRLSVSLHSSDEKTRSRIVPVNRRYSLKGLMKTLYALHRKLKREITFEYTVMEGVNDSPEEACGVARIARPLAAKVNLIPYNPVREAEFRRPSVRKLEIFRGLLAQHGLRVTVRQTAGRDIDAACGQLRLDRGTVPPKLS